MNTPERISISDNDDTWPTPTEYIRKDIADKMIKEAVDRVLQKRLGEPKQ